MNHRAPAVALACCCLTLLLAAAVNAQEESLGGERRKITVVSAVRARGGPQVAAPEVTRLKLGTVVAADARSTTQSEVGGKRDYWYRVNLPGGGQGWVFGALLADYDPARRAEVIRRIVEERLKVETMSFDDGVDFYNFVSAALADAKDPAERGALELARLHAIGRALTAVAEDEQGNALPPYRDFIKAHERNLYRHEFAGGWAVRPELFWALETKYRGTAVGDRIAWDASQALRQGECEGDEVCDFLGLHDTEGKYLSLYPQGAHAGEALQNLGRALASQELASLLKSRGGDKYAAESRAALRKAVTELRASVAKTTAPEKAAVLKRLNQLVPPGR